MQNNFYTKLYLYFMRRINRRAWHNLDNQQNNNQAQDSNTANVQKITGWDDQKPLLQHNLNTFGERLNKLKENKQVKKSNILHYINMNKSSQRRKPGDKNKRTVSVSQRNNAANIESSVQMHIENSLDMQNSNNISCSFANQPLKYEFSNIQILKFHVKHLQNEELTNNRLPNLSYLQSNIGNRNLCRNETHCGNNFIYNESQQNVNQFQVSQIYEIRRKLRTQSTKRRKKQKSMSQNSYVCQVPINNCSQLINYASTDLSNQNAYSQLGNPNASKFYKTLTNEWVQSKNKNSVHLIVEPPQKSIINNLFIQNQLNYGTNPKHSQKNIPLEQPNNLNNTCTNIQNMISQKTNQSNSAQNQYKTIHWKKSKPFTKFFQYKRSANLSSNNNKNSGSAGKNCPQNGRSCLKQIEGRKLQQIFSINRQIIELEEM